MSISGARRVSQSARQTIWTSLLTGTVTIAGLLFTQGIIDNRTEKLVTGIAVVVIPLGAQLANAIHHLAGARVTAARIIAGLPTGQQASGDAP
jgi:hypothetical protein